MAHLRFLTAGESHGPELTVIVEGVPAGLALLAANVDPMLARRQRGYGRGARMKIESDAVSFRGGVRDGKTLGSPIAMVIANRDHENWRDRMATEPLQQVPEPVTRPRPGHADLAAGLKYNHRDLRNVLERASARETAARTAAGAVAKHFLAAVGIDVFGHVSSIGAEQADVQQLPDAEIRTRAQASDLACADPQGEARMKDAIRAAAHAGDTLGGVFEVRVLGLPPGLGSHVQWDRKLDGRLAQALLSIHAVKGMEIGHGFAQTALPGSQVHDAIAYEAGGFRRTSNRAGGLEGGVTNGEPLILRGALKPIATLKKPLMSVDIESKQAFEAAYERSDVCAVAAASVIAEAMVALVIADAVLEKFGGDSMQETQRNIAGYKAQVAAY
jgi:chorismate synthase